MSEAGHVTCAVCGLDSPASAPVCQHCGRALPGLADRLFASDPQGPPAANPWAATPTAAALPASPAPTLPAGPTAEPPAAPEEPMDSLAVWTGHPTPPPPPTVDPGGTDGPPEAPRRRVPILVGAVIGVLLLATAAFLLFGQGDDADPGASPTTTSADSATTTEAPTTTSTTDPTPPAQPADLAVTADGSTSLAMTWTDAADNEDRYLVARVRGDVVDEIADLPANSAAYVVDGLEPGTLYCLTVAATNGATGEPAYVREACAVTGP